MPVCVLPDLPENDVLKRIKIKYPDDKIFKSFLFNERTYELFELIKFKEDFRSWFVGDYVYQDGSLYLITKVDPVFIFLNFINQTESKFNDVYHVVNEYDAIYKCLTKNKEINLEVVADVKNIDEEVYVKYNSEKVIKFLKFKIHKLNQCLRANSVQPLDNFVKVASYIGSKQEDAKESDYTAYSINLIADYLPKNLIDKLFELYGIKEDEKTKNSSPNQKQDKKRKLDLVEPIDDYTKLLPKDTFIKKQKVLTRTEKQLSKVDKTGMKSITSFFQKKTTW